MPVRPTVLVLGGSGQIGRELLRRSGTAWRMVAPSRRSLDVTDRARVAETVAAVAPSVIINAAAWTAVDRAEAEAAAAMAVNRDAACWLAGAAARADVPLLHLSTDYVFDGRPGRAWREDDPVAPLGVYGRSKAEGEAAIRALWDRHVILRTAWVFGVFGTNFVKTMVRLAGEQDEVRVVADQVGCPTAAGAVAETLLALAGRLVSLPPLAGAESPWGTFHYCGQPPVSWHGFAVAIMAGLAARGRRVPSVRAVSTAEYARPARRPANSVLDCGRLAAVWGVSPPDWRAGLDAVLDELTGGAETLAVRTGAGDEG